MTMTIPQKLIDRIAKFEKSRRIAKPKYYSPKDDDEMLLSTKMCEKKTALKELDIISAERSELPTPIDKYQLEPGFSETLFKFIDDKHLDEVEIYKKAGIDRRLFSKIRSNKDYHPQFGTCVLLGLAMELSTGEFKKLLRSANYSLSQTSYARVAIKYCFDEKTYDIDEVDKMVYEVAQKHIVDL